MSPNDVSQQKQQQQQSTPKAQIAQSTEPSVIVTTPTHNASKSNWCGYDSTLHARICSTSHVIAHPVLAAHTSKLLQNYNNNKNISNMISNNANASVNNSNNNNNSIATTTNTNAAVANNNNSRISRSRHRQHNEFTITASPQVQGYTKLLSTHNTSKLNTSMLNQLNPQLTPEQKLSRTISHVEKWLAEDQANQMQSSHILNGIGVAKSDIDSPTFAGKHMTMNANNITAMNKLKISDKVSKGRNDTSSPKKTFNKDILLTRKPQLAAEPCQSECENLLPASSDESNSQIGFTDNSLTTVHRYVHEHIHHHYHHFEDGTNVEVELIDGADDD